MKVFYEFYTNNLIDMWHSAMLDGELNSNLKMTKKEYSKFVERNIFPKWYVLRILCIPARYWRNK